MAHAVVTAIEIHPGTLFDSAGAVTRWLRTVGTETKAAVIAKCPPGTSRARWRRPGTGRMRASITASIARTGDLDSVALIRVRDPRAVYVLDGTAAKGTRYIYRDTARIAEAIRESRRLKPTKGLTGIYMKLPPLPGHRTLHLRVRGQFPNNFLFAGYNEVAKIHEALRPFHDPDAF